MSGVLDAILRKIILDGPETINADFQSDSFDISGVEGAFSVSFTYDGGDGSVDMVLALEVSIDNTNWVPFQDSEQTITDDSGTHLWDIASTGANYCRVLVTVTGGQIDVQRINFSGKRRH
jgi:hypothetical protein